MEIKDIKETENALFKRKEVVVEIASDAAPSNADVRKTLAEKFSVPEDAIKIKKIASGFGLKTFSVDANIYSSKSDLDLVEVKTKKEREAEKKAEDRLKAEKEAKEATKAEAEKPAGETPAENAEKPAQENKSGGTE